VRTARTAIGRVAVLTLLGACATPPPKPQPPDRVVLLPDASGAQGSVTVRSSAGQQVLNQPFESAAVNPQGEIARGVESEAAVRARYAQALGATPPRPVSYVLYFSQGDELTAESKAEFEKMKAAFAARPAPEVRVIGHTDTVGRAEINDALSLQRAQTVRNLLVSAGIRAEAIEATGRGERELLVPTADEVREPRNRRVEISVR